MTVLGSVVILVPGEWPRIEFRLDLTVRIEVKIFAPFWFVGDMLIPFMLHDFYV